MNKKTAIIFGGARGIGKNIVDKLVDDNYLVYIFDINKFDTKNDMINFIIIDLLNLQEVLDQLEKLYYKHTNIDSIIYNARAGNKFDFLDETSENFDMALNIMVKTPLFITQKLAQLKEKNNQINMTSIVYISSIASDVIGSEPASYHIAKSAINNMTKYISKHCGKYNIKSNAIAPGFIVQDEHLVKFNSEENTDFRILANSIHPLNEIGNSDDIAQMIIFLCSEKSKFINGQIITIDGGLTIQDSWDLLYKSSTI